MFISQRQKEKDNYKVTMMPRNGAKLSMDRNYKDNDQMNERKPKKEHIYELNGMTMEGKDEGKGSL